MLFLADEAHRNCAKVKLTRQHPPMGRRADCLVIGSSKVPDGQKETAALNFSKPPLHKRVKMCLLYDGFFSFAVVRQLYYF